MSKRVIISTFAAISFSVSISIQAGSSLDHRSKSSFVNPPHVNEKNIKNRYIVLFKEGISKERKLINSKLSISNSEHIQHFDRLNGFAADLSAQQVSVLSQDPQVKSIEPDRIISIEYKAATEQIVDSWALDRIDQYNLPLDNTYAPQGHGAGVHAYVISTGIYLEHQDFAGRAVYDYTASSVNESQGDYNGHGTHMAGVIGSNTWGVAREVILHDVKVLNGDGEGTLSGMIEGINYITDHHQSPAVAVIPTSVYQSDALDEAINRSIEAGVVYAVPAGDLRKNACDYSPSSVNQAISVSASGQDDKISVVANYGECVDLFAPGLWIKSTWHTGRHVNNTISHSPISAALVAGAAAIMRGYDDNCTPTEIKQKLLNKAVDDRLSGVPDMTNNKLLSIRNSHLGGCKGTDITQDDSLILALPFNGNANDMSKHGHHGSVSGAQLTSDRFGRPASAYFFNGNDRILINGLKNYNWDKNFTASVWFRRTGRWGDYMGVMSNGYYTNGSFEVRMGRESNGQFLFYRITGPNRGGGTYAAYRNKWHHVVMTYDGERVKGYFNGTLISNSARNNNMVRKNHPVFIGHAGTGMSREYFYGAIDDVRIYNRALSAEEVTEIFENDGDSALFAD